MCWDYSTSNDKDACYKDSYYETPLRGTCESHDVRSFSPSFFFLNSYPALFTGESALDCVG